MNHKLIFRSWREAVLVAFYKIHVVNNAPNCYVCEETIEALTSLAREI